MLGGSSMRIQSTKKGLTIVEVLVALVLLAALVLVSAGLLIPLQVTRNSNVSTQALSYARSYFEMVRQSWLDPTKYESSPTNTGVDPVWPTWGTGSSVDLRLPTGWTLTRTATIKTNAMYSDGISSFSAASNLPRLRDTLREVTIVVQPTNGPSVTVRSLISLTNP
jgi:prepilin-type N-terminal cleavage/methylation domain-containing protein